MAEKQDSGHLRNPVMAEEQDSGHPCNPAMAEEQDSGHPCSAEGKIKTSLLSASMCMLKRLRSFGVCSLNVSKKAIPGETG